MQNVLQQQSFHITKFAKKIKYNSLSYNKMNFVDKEIAFLTQKYNLYIFLSEIK